MAECLFGHWGAYSWPIMGVKVHGIRLGSAWDPRGILWDPPRFSWDPPFWVCAALWVFQENGASRTRASAPYIILKKETFRKAPGTNKYFHRFSEILKKKKRFDSQMSFAK